jgi:hypothetical protein
MSTRDSSPTTLCLWCNGLLEWGTEGIEYDLCERCVPSVIESLHARLASPEPIQRPRPAWERFLAAAAQ